MFWHRFVLPLLRCFLPPPISRILGKKPAPLLSLLEETIAREGPLNFEQYMNAVLQHPEYGYYRHANPIGPDKDFGTAPEISQMFGEMIALWCLEEWGKMGKPDPFVLLELGPGRGTMLRDILLFTKPVEDFQKAFRLRLLESNVVLKKIQEERLAEFSPVHIADPGELDPHPTLVLANEFFDNIPLRQFAKTSDGWHESVVDFKRGRLFLSLNPKACPLPPDDLFAEELKEREEGWIHEFSNTSRQIIAQLAEHLIRYKGAAVLIDYGYTVPSGYGTLDSWYKSRASHILRHPGNADVTADVDFEALARTAEKNGVQAEAIVGQGEFLARLGIGHRVDFFKKQTNDDAVRKKVDSMLDMLVSRSKMGVVWKVLVLRSGAESKAEPSLPSVEGGPHA